MQTAGLDRGVDLLIYRLSEAKFADNKHTHQH